MRYAVLVTGPAGSGKSTFCSSLLAHAQTIKRPMHLFNLDPAAEKFDYQPSVDIKDLVSLDEVMEDLEFGPNGGLIYCFEYLLENTDWLEDALGEFEDDFLVIDCPGQIELYTHFPIMSRFVEVLQKLNFRLCTTYLLETQFMEDRSKFFSGVMSAMSCMINLELPHINLLSKMDLVKSHMVGSKRRKNLDRFLDPDPLLLVDEVNAVTNPRFHALNQAIVQLIEDFNMVQFLPLDVTDEDSLELVLSHIDNTLQYGEVEEPKEPRDLNEGDFESPDY